MSPIIKRKGEKFTLPGKYLLFILTILCTGMVLLTFNTTVFSGPLGAAAGYIIVPFQEGISAAGSFLRSRSEELGQIRELYELDSQYDEYEKVGARIIARDSGNWFYSFVINKGSEDGLMVDMNVMAGSGLVGRIVDTGPNWSKVKAIIADDSNVSAMVLSSSDNMIVNGDLRLYASGVISFEQLKDSEDVVVEGDKVVTSNISDKYLPGILIGYINTINTDANNLTKSGYITPAVDFEHLEEVLVILEMKQTVEE